MREASVRALAAAPAAVERLAPRIGAHRRLQPVRVVDDPLTPLVGPADSEVRARAVFAPAPGDALPPLPERAWKYASMSA